MSRRLALMAGLGGCLLASVAASSAHATLFSFASDVNSNSFTFAGTAGSGGAFNITDFSRPNTFTLLVDDNNGPAPTVSIPVEFHANLTLSGGTSTALGGTLFQHSYRVLGTFGFFDTMGNALLTVNIGPNAGLLTVPGTATAWATSGAVLGSDSFADVTYTASQAFVTALGGTSAAALYGITLGAGGTAQSIGPDDFAFDLSAINAGAIGSAVGIDSATKAPTSTWRSESSYSGSGFFGVPAPGVVSLMALGGTLLVRRRQR
jgi:hypothetical protein